MSETALVPSVTFEQAAASPKPVSAEFLTQALNGEYETAPGQNVHFLEAYLNTVPADESDKSFESTPNKVAQFRNDLSDFIGSHLKVTTRDLDDSSQAYIQTRKVDFIHQLAVDKQRVSDYIHRSAYLPNEPYPRDAMDFQGFTLPTTDGEKDLLGSERAQNVLANISIQRDLDGRFIRWYSADYIAADNPDETKVTHRIYLNPKAEDSVRIFAKVADEVDNQGLKVRGKVWDRSSEALNRSSFKTLRGDGIVFYAPTSEANQLLGIVEAVYTSEPAAFNGRKTSRIPMRIGDGVAIGEEPGIKGESLTSHRKHVLEGALSEVRTGLNLKPGEKIPVERAAEVLQVFRPIWSRVAAENGIDPLNLAFNKK